jgi:hypothetical protein
VAINIITTGRPDLTAYAADHGYLRGTRLDDEPRYRREDVRVDFLDLHWEQPDWSGLLEAAEWHRPKYAIAGDYDGNNYDEVHRRAGKLREYAENVIVVPHDPGEIERVPEWCVVGYSTPSAYAGTDAPVWEYYGRDVHILGGTPHGQFELLDYLGRDTVVSMDCNSHHKAATIGAKAWHSEPPHWRKVDGDDAVERAYRRAVDNLAAEHQQRGLA